MSKNKYIYSTLLLMTFGGTFNIKTSNQLRKLLFLLWRIVLNVTFLGLIVSSFIDLRNKGFTKLDLVTKHYVYLGGSIFIAFRVNYHYFNGGTSGDIVKQIRKEFKYKTDIGFAEKDLRNYVKVTNILPFMWVFYGTLLGQCDILLPLILKKERELSLPMWFPFDWTVSPYYEMVVLVQMFVQYVVVITEASMDMFFANTIILTSGQFKLLGWELKHVLHKTLLDNGVDLDTVLTIIPLSNSKNNKFPSPNVENTSENGALLAVIHSDKFRAELLTNLKKLIEFHQSLLNLSSSLDKFFSLANLSCFCTVLAATVLLEYALAMTQNVIIRVLNAMYVLASLIILFIPCFFGSLLTTHAEGFLSELHDLPWYLCDGKFKTNYVRLQQRARKPIMLSIGKFGVLSLETYLWIIRASYSYLTVLQQLTANV